MLLWGATPSVANAVVGLAVGAMTGCIAMFAAARYVRIPFACPLSRAKAWAALCAALLSCVLGALWRGGVCELLAAWSLIGIFLFISIVDWKMRVVPHGALALALLVRGVSLALGGFFEQDLALACLCDRGLALACPSDQGLALACPSDQGLVHAGGHLALLVGQRLGASAWEGLVLAAGVAVLAWLIGKIVGSAALGGGDVKLLFVCGCYVGAAGGVAVLGLACLGGLAVSAGTHQRTFPFAPSIAAAFYIVLVAMQIA